MMNAKECHKETSIILDNLKKETEKSFENSKPFVEKCIDDCIKQAINQGKFDIDISKEKIWALASPYGFSAPCQREAYTTIGCFIADYANRGEFKLELLPYDYFRLSWK